MRRAFLVLALAGCAGPPPVWVKPGATAAEFEADKRYCEFEMAKVQSDPSLKTGVGQGIDLSIRKRDLGIACMRSRGYSQQ